MRASQFTRTVAALTAASALLTGVVSCSARERGNAADDASDTPVFADDGKLQPLKDGFPKSPLSIVVVDEAGSDDGIYARQVADAASKIAPVDIKVLDRPEFGSTYGAWEALDWIADQRGGDEGYMMAVVTLPGSTIDLGGSLISGNNFLQFDLEDANIVPNGVLNLQVSFLPGTPAPIPEPGPLPVFASVLVGLLSARWIASRRGRGRSARATAT